MSAGADGRKGTSKGPRPPLPARRYCREPAATGGSCLLSGLPLAVLALVGDTRSARIPPSRVPLRPRP